MNALEKITIMKGRNTQWKTEFTMRRTVFGRKSRRLLYSLPITSQRRKRAGRYLGTAHLRYIKQHKRVFYANLLTSCKLNSYLADIDEQAENLFIRLVKDLAEKENITEKLKATDQMVWVQRMNNIRNCATEIVNAEMIYTV